MPDFASVTAVKNPPGSANFDVVVSILKGIDNASRTGGADFGIRVTLTYVSSNNTVETFDSGRRSIKTDTIRIADVDTRTVAIQLPCSFGNVLPGANPSFSATAQLVHGGGDELGPPEQSFPQG